MSFSTTEAIIASAADVEVTDEALSILLSDGRRIEIPLTWYPRLRHASADERIAYELIGGGRGIHWDSIDEDISVEDIVAGRPSQESQSSLARWLARRSG